MIKRWNEWNLWALARELQVPGTSDTVPGTRNCHYFELVSSFQITSRIVSTGIKLIANYESIFICSE